MVDTHAPRWKASLTLQGPLKRTHKRLAASKLLVGQIDLATRIPITVGALDGVTDRPHYPEPDIQSGSTLTPGVSDVAPRVVGTTLEVFVNEPSELKHLPGIMFSLHNASGSSFTRITLQDYDNVIDFMQKHRDAMKDSLAKAVQVHEKILQLQDILHSTGNS